MADLCKTLMKHREDRIQQLGLDGSIWRPAGNWGASEIIAVYKTARRLMGGDNLDHLLLLAQHLTGYALWALKDAQNTVPPKDPGGLNDSILECSLHPDHAAIARCAQIRSEIPPYLHIGPPAKFGEVGWIVDGVLVNHNTAAYWERMAMLYRAGLLDHSAGNCLRPGARVLEIGAGYGALAWYIQEAAPGVRYTVVDLPETLVYSSVGSRRASARSLSASPSERWSTSSCGGVISLLVVRGSCHH